MFIYLINQWTIPFISRLKLVVSFNVYVNVLLCYDHALEQGGKPFICRGSRPFRYLQGPLYLENLST